MKTLLRSLFIAVVLFASSAACGRDLSGKWTLYVENPGHHVVTTLTVKFTNDAAASCMSGEWKIVNVVSTTTEDKNFFPASDPLSYRIENGQLTIGRNGICDAYLWLQGALGEASVQGDYFSLGFGGSSPLGHFKMSQAK